MGSETMGTHTHHRSEGCHFHEYLVLQRVAKERSRLFLKVRQQGRCWQKHRFCDPSLFIEEFYLHGWGTGVSIEYAVEAPWRLCHVDYGVSNVVYFLFWKNLQRCFLFFLDVAPRGGVVYCRVSIFVPAAY